MTLGIRGEGSRKAPFLLNCRELFCYHPEPSLLRQALRIAQQMAEKMQEAKLTA